VVVQAAEDANLSLPEKKEVVAEYKGVSMSFMLKDFSTFLTMLQVSH
jgi:hypothetical protein